MDTGTSYFVRLSVDTCHIIVTKTLNQFNPMPWKAMLLCETTLNAQSILASLPMDKTTSLGGSVRRCSNLDTSITGHNPDMCSVSL
jgi:hypothetical protein